MNHRRTALSFLFLMALLSTFGAVIGHAQVGVQLGNGPVIPLYAVLLPVLGMVLGLAGWGFKTVNTNNMALAVQAAREADRDARVVKLEVRDGTVDERIRKAKHDAVNELMPTITDIELRLTKELGAVESRLRDELHRLEERITRGRMPA